MNSRSKTISIACTEADVTIAERCRVEMKPFPPSKSTLALLLFRHGMAEILRGNLSLPVLAETYSNVNMETLADEIGGQV